MLAGLFLIVNMVRWHLRGFTAIRHLHFTKHGVCAAADARTRVVMAGLMPRYLSTVQELSSKLTGQLADLTSMVRRDLGGEARKKVNTLIITDVHARDIIDTFVRDSVMDAREFAWESQLRYYWDRTADDLMIRQCTGEACIMMCLQQQ